MAYGDKGILKGYRSSPSIDTVLFRAISPLNIPATDAATEIRLHDSVKVQGSLNMEEKSKAMQWCHGVGIGRKEENYYGKR